MGDDSTIGDGVTVGDGSAVAGTCAVGPRRDEPQDMMITATMPMASPERIATAPSDRRIIGRDRSVG
jgi:acetyltransferase-like isoleucine patch superfamily enzyme